MSTCHSTRGWCYSVVIQGRRDLKAGLQLREVHLDDLLDQLAADQAPIREQIRVKCSPTDRLERKCGLDDVLWVIDRTATVFRSCDDARNSGLEQSRSFGAGVVE